MRKLLILALACSTVSLMCMFKNPCQTTFKTKLAYYTASLEKRMQEINEQGTDIGNFKTRHAKKEFESMQQTLQQEYSYCMSQKKQNNFVDIARYYTN